MQEVCEVVKISRGYAYIKVERKDACKFCNACAFNEEGTLHLPAIMDIECKAGDRVVVEMPEKQAAFAPLVLFMIPLLMLLIGLGIGKILNGDVYMVIFGLLFVAFGALIAVIVEKLLRSNRRYMAVITDRLLNDDTLQGDDLNDEY